MGAVSSAEIFKVVACKSMVVPGYLAKHHNYRTLVFIYTYATTFMFLSNVWHLEALATVVKLNDIRGVLKFFSEYSITVSICYTLLQISKLDHDFRCLFSNILSLGTVMYSFCSPYGPGTFWIPASISLFIFFISWVVESYRQKKLQPNLKKCLKFLLPGFVLVAVAFILRHHVPETSADSDVRLTKAEHIMDGFFQLTLAMSLTALVCVKKKEEIKETVINPKKLPSGNDILCDVIGCWSCL